MRNIRDKVYYQKVFDRYKIEKFYLLKVSTVYLATLAFGKFESTLNEPIWLGDSFAIGADFIVSKVPPYLS